MDSTNSCSRTFHEAIRFPPSSVVNVLMRFGKKKMSQLVTKARIGTGSSKLVCCLVEYFETDTAFLVVNLHLGKL